MYVLNWVQRSDLGWGVTGSDAAGCAKGLVIHYNGPDTNLNSHKECIAYWQATRRAHMDKSDPAHGWSDIGYSFGACKHGYVLVGRGYQHYQAAQGTSEGNRDYHSVTLMCGNTDEVTLLQINAVRELQQYLVSKGKGNVIKGHRDFYNTSCPGDRLYAMVKDGTFKRPPQGEDDELPQYVNVENTNAISLPVDTWVALQYDREWSDPNHHHWDKGGPSVAIGGDNGAFYQGSADVVITGAQAGSEFAFRSIEVDDNQEVVEIGKIDRHYARSTTADLRYPLTGYVNAGRKLRVQVMYVPVGDTTTPARITKCQATLFIWLKP